MTNIQYLSMDQGSHSSRAMLFDSHGNCLAEHQVSIDTFEPKSDWVEHDAEQIVLSLQRCIDQVTSQATNQLIACAGLATQRSSIVAWERHSGKALSPVISWRDRRAAQFILDIGQHNELIQKKTGLQLSPHYGASKIRWCLQNLSDVQSALNKSTLLIGPLSSFLSQRLTHSPDAWVDPGNASRTLLWNQKTLQWDDQLLALFGIPVDCLPNCVANRHEFGDIPLPSGSVPLQLVGGDQNCALFANGHLDKQTLYINIGTGAFVTRLIDSELQQRLRLLQSILYHDDQQTLWALEGTVNGAASALLWAQQQGHIPKGPLASIISKNKPDLFFLNGIGGIGSPFWQAEYHSHFVGSGSEQEKLAAILESIIFLLKANIEKVIQLSGKADRIQISGGLGQNDYLCQNLADLTAIEVNRSEQTEATAKGTAFLLSQSTQWQQQITDTFSPHSDTGIQKQYQTFLDLFIRSLDKK